MANYYVNRNAQQNGDHEVHLDGCTRMPTNPLYLGSFSTCHDAVRAAKQYFPRSNGCYWCSPACHTT